MSAINNKEINIELFDATTYQNCINLLLLYFYRDFITLYDGVNEIMIKKSEISSIYNKYNDYNNVYNRYIKSTIIITCNSGLTVNCLICSSPQSTPNTKGTVVVTNVGTYTIDTSITNYTNGTSVDKNSYKKYNGNIVLIDGANTYEYSGLQSFYKVLQKAGINFLTSQRIDYNNDSLANQNVIYQLLGTSISPRTGSYAGTSVTSSCVARFESMYGIGRTSLNINNWTEVSYGVTGVAAASIGQTPRRPNIDTIRLLPNGDTSIQMFGKISINNFTRISNLEHLLIGIVAYIPNYTLFDPLSVILADGTTTFQVTLDRDNSGNVVMGYSCGSNSASTNVSSSQGVWKLYIFNIITSPSNASNYRVNFVTGTSVVSFNDISKVNAVLDTTRTSLTIQHGYTTSNNDANAPNIAGVYVFSAGFTDLGINNSRFRTYVEENYGV